MEPAIPLLEAGAGRLAVLYHVLAPATFPRERGCALTGGDAARLGGGRRHGRGPDGTTEKDAGAPDAP